MDKVQKAALIILAIVIAAALVLYFCCGNSPAVPAEEVSEAEAPAAVPAETAAAQDTAPGPAETAAPMAQDVDASPAERAAARGLPAPPDIDIYGWEFLYAGINNGVGRYHPDVSNIDNQYVDSRIYGDTFAFLSAAREAGYTVWISVAYRNFEYNLFNYENAMLNYGGSYEAAKHVFPPGCSEHSTGLAIDFTDKDMYAANYYDMHDEEMTSTEAYGWLCEHCTEYGFIVRYPEGKEDYYVRACPYGHFRYVGREAAEYITENGLCLEEFFELYGRTY